MRKGLVLGVTATIMVAAVAGVVLEAKAETDSVTIGVTTTVLASISVQAQRDLDCGDIQEDDPDCKNVASGQVLVQSNDDWNIKLEDNTSLTENVVTVAAGTDNFDFDLEHDVTEPAGATGTAGSTVNITGTTSSWDFNDPPGTYVGTILVTVSNDAI